MRPSVMHGAALNVSRQRRTLIVLSQSALLSPNKQTNFRQVCIKSKSLFAALNDAVASSGTSPSTVPSLRVRSLTPIHGNA